MVMYRKFHRSENQNKENAPNDLVGSTHSHDAPQMTLPCNGLGIRLFRNNQLSSVQKNLQTSDFTEHKNYLSKRLKKVHRINDKILVDG